MAREKPNPPAVGDCVPAVCYVLDVALAEVAGWVVLAELTGGGYEVVSNVCCPVHLMGVLGDLIRETANAQVVHVSAGAAT